MNPIKLNPTHEIFDSSKVTTYMDCPRQFFYQYVLGWRKDKPNLHLAFGSAWHLAMEHLNIEGRSAETIQSAFDILSEYMRDNYPDCGDLRGKKTLANAFTALIKYVMEYNHDTHEVIHTEVAGSVPISSQDDRLHLRIDAIIRDQGKYKIQEYKTGSGITRSWLDQWRNSFQVSTYTFLLHCIYEENEIGGLMIDATHFYANELKEPAKIFARVPINKTKDMLEAWLWEAQQWTQLIKDDMNRLMQASEGDRDMRAFRRNPQSCTKYFGCPYLDYCSAHSNPLQHCAIPPIDPPMKVEWWDPSDYEARTKAKKIIEA